MTFLAHRPKQHKPNMSDFTPAQTLTDFVKFSFSKYKRMIQIIPLLMIVLIVFESCQQYYYIIQFELASTDDLSIVQLLIAHAYRWLVWFVTIILYFSFLLEKGKIESLFAIQKWPQTISHLVLLLIFNLSIISIIQIKNHSLPLAEFGEHFIFYFFQKTPIFLLAHCSMIGIMYLVHTNRSMNIQLLSLKSEAEAKANTSDSSATFDALSVRVGKRDKVIPFQEIVWIEAYDYCVKIHTDQLQVYAMRNSLKALEVSLRNAHFLRVHRKSIVNMKKVEELHYAQSTLRLTGGQEIEVAKTRRKEIKDFLQTAS